MGSDIVLIVHYFTIRLKSESVYLNPTSEKLFFSINNEQGHCGFLKVGISR